MRDHRKNAEFVNQISAATHHGLDAAFKARNRLKCLEFLERFQDANGKVNCTEIRETFERLEADSNALGTHAYCSSDQHLSGYRLTIGFDTLEQLDAAHQAVVNCGKRVASTLTPDGETEAR